MAFKDEIQISAVPMQLIAPMWQHVGHLIEDGCRASQTSFDDRVARLVCGTNMLWVIVQGSDVVAAFVTEIIIRVDGRKVVLLSGMAGRGARQWALKVLDAMNAYGKSSGCDTLAFYGRKGWLRFYPDFKAVRTVLGETLYERGVK
jgi:hypothetical protein